MMKFKKYEAIDIDWDVDSEEDLKLLPNKLSLPKEVNPESLEEVSDYITDLTGFCHKGFRLRRRFT